MKKFMVLIAGILFFANGSLAQSGIDQFQQEVAQSNRLDVLNGSISEKLSEIGDFNSSFFEETRNQLVQTGFIEEGIFSSSLTDKAQGFANDSFTNPYTFGEDTVGVDGSVHSFVADVRDQRLASDATAYAEYNRLQAESYDLLLQREIEVNGSDTSQAKFYEERRDFHQAVADNPDSVMTDGKLDREKVNHLKNGSADSENPPYEEKDPFAGGSTDLTSGGGSGGTGLGSDSGTNTPAAPPEFDTTEINAAICDIFSLMEGGLGALLSVAAGIGALFAMAFGAYKAGYGLIVVAAAGFVIRSFVAIFFGTFDCGPGI